MVSVVELLVIVVLVLFPLLYWLSRPRRLVIMGDKLPGPAAIPLFGNALQLGTDTSDFYYNLKEICSKYYGKPVRLWIGQQLNVVLTQARDIEVLLRSNKEVNKAGIYDFLKPWIGDGLVTSTGSKWRENRKILTPTFHFKILEQFVDTFYANGEVLVDCLRERVGGPAFNVHQYCTLCTLDNICETAMGLKINAQRDVESEYVKAVNVQTFSMMQRSIKPWLQVDLIYKLTNLSVEAKKSLKVLHDTSNAMVKKRRQEMTKERAAREGSTGATSVTEDGVKRRLAFLDLLIQSTFDGSQLTDQDIRDEVDTFMIAGHDTSAAAIAFALWNLAWHQDIQEAVVQELNEVWPDPREPLAFNHLQELKCLERVIKESLRLFPSAPYYGRQLSEDVVLSDGLVVPKNANLMVAAYIAHKDPEVFPDPEKFDPDRFLPENVQGRHPYAYLPFSAGPRNCIGQKFAILEVKCIIAQVLRNYRILPGSAKPDLKLAINFVIHAVNGVPVKIEARQ